jgi:hypothetical protein
MELASRRLRGTTGSRIEKMTKADQARRTTTETAIRRKIRAIPRRKRSLTRGKKKKTRRKRLKKQKTTVSKKKLRSWKRTLPGTSKR